MKVRYLIYNGPKNEGTITLKEVDATSQFRKVPYTKDKVWRIGVDIPNDIADIVHKSYKTLFFIHEKELNNHEAFEDELWQLIAKYEAIIGDDYKQIIEKIFDAEKESDNIDNTQKNDDKKEKKNRKRRLSK